LDGSRSVNSVDAKGTGSPVLSLFLQKFHAYLIRGFVSWTSYKTDMTLTILGWLLPVFTYFFIGEMIDAATAPHIQPYGDYGHFMLVGVAFQGFILSAFTTFTHVIRNEQRWGTLEFMLLSPTRISTVLVLSGTWSFVINSLNTVVVLLVGTFLLGITYPDANIFSAAVVLLLVVVSSMGIGMISAGIIMVVKRGDPVAFFFNSLTYLLAGVLFPVQILPAWIRWFSNLIPLTHGLQGLRLALIKGYGLTQLSGEITTLLLFCLVLLPLGMYCFSLGFDRARDDGSLAHY
jgi:ABC-2 type transport system permease protein